MNKKVVGVVYYKVCVCARAILSPIMHDESASTLTATPRRHRPSLPNTPSTPGRLELSMTGVTVGTDTGSVVSVRVGASCDETHSFLAESEGSQSRPVDPARGVGSG